MRSADPLLVAALADGSVRLRQADLYDITLSDGTTRYWTSYTSTLLVGSTRYTGAGPFLTRSKWGVRNTMEVPQLEIYFRAGLASFEGGPDFISQVHDRLLDGANVVFSRVFILETTDTSLGAVVLFGGDVGPVAIDGLKATVTVKGANNKLDMNAPRNVYQPGCIIQFCDPNCTLLLSAFTSSFVVDSGATRTFVPWVTPPADPTLFPGGTLTITSGDAAPQKRSILAADASGCTLIYPLHAVPSAGDTFDALQMDDKTLALCTSRSNQQHWRGFPYIPAATLAT